MPPKKVTSGNFKTIEIKCRSGHEVAEYRKPRPEWGHQTHKLWLLDDRIKSLDTLPPILTADQELIVPEIGTPIQCGREGCQHVIGAIAMIKGAVAIQLNKQGIQPAQG